MSFQIGCNLPWNFFYGDYGGYDQFQQSGARVNKQVFVDAFNDMVQNRGAEICRVWLFPYLSSSGVFTSGNCVTGIGGTLLDDIEAVMEAAAQESIQLQFCYFSFDCLTNRPGIAGPTLWDSFRDANCRQQLMQNLVAPIAASIKASPNYSVIHSHDLFNEIDWCMTSNNDANPSEPWRIGDFNQHDFASSNPLTYNEAYTFLSAMRSAVRSADADVPITIGVASLKWCSAWESLVEFNSAHHYFAQAYTPLSNPPSTYGLTKPTGIGEHATSYPANSAFIGQVEGALPKTHLEILGDAFSSGYEFMLGWSYFVDTESGATNGGYNATTGAEAKAFAESLDQAATIQLTPTSASCDETDVMTLRAVNQFGVAVDSTNPSVTTGTFANAVYDPDSFQWTLDYTSPTCASGISDVTVSLDVNGVTANESLAIATCSLFSDDTRLTISQTNCSCETALEYIGGAVDIDCPRLGEVLQYRVIGCNCEYECGKPKFEQIHRTRNPVSLSGDVLSIGPLVTTELPVIDTSCEDC